MCQEEGVTIGRSHISSSQQPNIPHGVLLFRVENEGFKSAIFYCLTLCKNYARREPFVRAGVC